MRRKEAKITAEDRELIREAGRACGQFMAHVPDKLSEAVALTAVSVIHLRRAGMRPQALKRALRLMIEETQ